VASLVDNGAGTLCPAGALDITNDAVVRINPQLVVTSSPVDRTNCANTDVQFAISATGMELTYQWYKGGAELNQETNSILVMNNVQKSEEGTYSVVVHAATCGGPITNTVNLAVNDLLSLSGPTSVTNDCSVSTAEFTVLATGTGVTLQWYHDNLELVGETNSTLFLTNVTPASAGTYWVVAQAVCGGPLTNSAYLEVFSRPEPPFDPRDQTSCVNFPNPPLTVSVTNGLTVDWYDEAVGGTLVGSNTPSITPVITNGTVTYYAEARDLRTGCTSAERTPVTLVLEDCPLISFNASNRIVNVQWFGELELQAASMLTNGTAWQPLTNGIQGATNNWTTSSTNAPQEYFRVAAIIPSGPPISISAGTNGQLAVGWIGNHVLQATPSLSSAPFGMMIWTNVAFGKLGTNNAWATQGTNSQCFFRLNPNALP